MAISREEERLYRALFLTAEDMAGLEAREAVHGEQAEPGDDAWVPCNGINAGFQVWQRLRGTDLSRVVDVRSLFPADTFALRYHDSRRTANAEGLRPIPEWTMPGHEVAAFSGKDPFGLGTELRIYLFVQGRVCAKIFVTGLQAEEDATILGRAHDRIGQALHLEVRDAPGHRDQDDG